MATSTKVTTKSGIRCKAIVRFGRHSRTKAFSLKASAKAWIKELEYDQELAVALNTPGAGMRLERLAELYLEQWTGKDTNVPTKCQYRVDAEGKKRLTEINAHHIREHLKRLADR